MNSLYTAFKLLGVKEPVEVLKVVRREKINGELNENIHSEYRSDPKVHRMEVVNFTAITPGSAEANQ
jgi:hypothetical protein